MKRTGVLGGTFNPVHLGHLRAAEEVAEQLELERVWMVPSARPPHKEESDDDPLAPAEQRLRWLQAACESNPRLVPSDLELRRGGTSYTVDTLRALNAEHGGERLVFLIGSDAFAEIASWRDPSSVFELADFAVMTRPGTPGSLSDWLPASLRSRFDFDAQGWEARHRSGGRVNAVRISALDISSSDIRARARAGRSLRYLVPDAVLRDIDASNVFSAGR